MGTNDDRKPSPYRKEQQRQGAYIQTHEKDEHARRMHQAGIRKSWTFDSAHQLRHAGEGHKCANLHGHTYTVTVDVVGTMGAETGWVMDFADLKEMVKPLIQALDHQNLNEALGTDSPTAERVAEWFFLALNDQMTGVGATLRRVEVQEGAGGIAYFPAYLI